MDGAQASIFAVFDSFETISELIAALLLVGARVFTFLSVSPFFSNRAMGRTVRVGLMLALSILLVPNTLLVLQANGTGTPVVMTLVFKELVLGLVLGMLTWLPMRGLELAGVLLDTQRGSTTAEDFDVIFNAQTTPTAILFAQLFSGFFFATGGFLMTQMIIFQSYEIWPANAPLPPISDEVIFLFGEFAGVLIFTSVVFALPISGFMFLADIAIAFIARSAPTLNALTFGMPVKSAILLIMLVYYLDIAYPAVMDTFMHALTLTEKVFSNVR